MALAYCRRPGSMGTEEPEWRNEENCAVARKLTQNEIYYAERIFKNGIDYNEVIIHNEPIFPFQGRQAVTPNGQIYFPTNEYLPDFGLGKDDDVSWFIHEMMHVWQYQMGYPVKLNYIFGPHNYDYELDATKTLADYNLEQQGDIIADYFYMKILGWQQALRMTKYNRNDLPLYEKVLGKFLVDPKDKSSLPKSDKAKKEKAKNIQKNLYND